MKATATIRMALCGLTLAGLSLPAMAQMKIGANPSQIVPGAKLQVDGNNTTTTPAKLLVDSAGKVGIGTAAPGTSLDVNGAITQRETAVAVSGNAATIPDNTSQVQLTGAATAAITLTAPVAPNAGQRLVIFNNTTGGFPAVLNGTQVAMGRATEFIYSNSAWQATGSAGAAATGTPWDIQGNAGTSPDTNFVGTTDNADFVTRTNNAERMRVTAAGNVGIGTTAPGTSLDVNGAITNRETAVAVAGNAATIAANTSLVQLTGAATGNIAVTGPASPNTGQRLIIFNNTTGGFPAVLNGTQVAMGRATEFIYSNSAWQATGSAGAAAANTQWDIQGNTGTSPDTNFVGTTDNAAFVTRTNNAERMRVTATGKVGIGTAAPGSLLDLGASAGSSASDSAGKKLAIYNNAAGADFYGLGVSSGLLQFHAASAASEDPGMVLTNGGNVGIGTTAPGTSLDVNGAITNRETAVAVAGNAATIAANTSLVQLTGAATGNIALTGPASPNTGQRLIIYNNTTGGFPAVLNGTQVAMGRATEFIYSNSAWQATGSAGAAAANTQWDIQGNTGTSPDTNFVGTTDNADFVTRTNNAERMRVTAAGNVGIGTTAPGTSLDVNGAITNRETAVAVAGNAATISANTSQVQLTGAATADITVTAPAAPNAGQRLVLYNNTTGGFPAVLNGTPVPTGQALEFVYSNNGWRASNGGAAAANTQWGILGNTGTSAATNFVGTTDSVDLVTRTNNAERMRVTAGGKVGIGTATPHAPLQLANTAANRKIVLYEDADNDNQYCGFGINQGTLRYQVNAAATSHVFFAPNAAGTASNELMRIQGNGNVGIGTAAAGTSLDVNGAITNRETAVAVAGNAATITANTSQVQLTGAATADITVTAPAAPNAGQRLVLYNNTTGGFPAVLNGTPVPTGQVLEFVYSNNGWRASNGGAAAANTQWGIMGNTGTSAATNFVGTTDSVDLVTRTNNAERMRVTATGKVGIGTAAPGSLLDLGRSAGSSTSDSAGKKLAIYNNAAGADFYGLGVSSSLLQFHAGSTASEDPGMVLTNGGKVGIGTAAAGTSLDVNGAITNRETAVAVAGNAATIAANTSQVQLTGAATANIAVAAPAAPNAGQRLVLYNNTTGGFPAVLNGAPVPAGQALEFVYSSNGWRASNGGAAAANTQWGILGNTGTSAATNFVGTTDNADFVTRTNNAERMRVTAGGNVGIGTATPHAPLQFANSVAKRKIVLFEAADNDNQYEGFGSDGDMLRYQVTGTGQSHAFFAGTSATASDELMRIQGDGKVGIGTATPHAPLQLANSAANRKIVLYEDADNNHQYYGLGINQGGTMRYQISDNGPTQHVFYAATSATASKELMRIQANGNVGIGTATPHAPLQLANTGANRKIVLYEEADNDNQYFGLGINQDAVRYQVGNGVSSHLFYAGTSATASKELMRIQGNGNVGIGTTAPGTSLDVNGAITNRETAVAVAGNAAAIPANTSQVQLTGAATANIAVAAPAAPNAGQRLVIFNNTTGGFPAVLNGAQVPAGQALEFVYSNGWRASNGGAAAANTQWGILGNTGTSAATNFVGTTDNADFVTRTNNAERMRVTAGGNVGIGTTTPHAPLQFANTGVNRKIVLYEEADNDNQYFGLGINQDAVRYQVGNGVSSHVFYAGTSATASKELMRIKGDGTVAIGAVSQNALLSVQTASSEGIHVSSSTSDANGLLFLEKTAASSAADNFVIFRAGGSNIGSIDATGASGVAYNTTSDIRLKENIRSTHFGIADVMKIQVRDYNYKADKNSQQTGFLAQQLYTVFPNAVTVGGDDVSKPWLVDYSKVTPLLTKAIQDQQVRIEAQQAEIDALKAENKELQEHKATTARLMERVKQMEQMLGIKEIEGSAKVAGK